MCSPSDALGGTLNVWTRRWILPEGWGLLCNGSVETEDGLTSQLWDGVEDSLAFSCIFHSLFLPTP